MNLLKPLLTFIAAASFVVAAGFSAPATAQTQEVPTTESIFESELQQRGIPFSKLEPYLYDVRIKRNTVRVSLSNIHKTFARDGNAESVKQFVASIVRPAFVLSTDWDKVKEHIFVNVMAMETKGVNSAMVKRLSRHAVGVIAYYDQITNMVHILSAGEIKSLNVPAEIIWKTAIENLEKIAKSININFSEVNGQKLGIIETRSVNKASLILTQELKSKVEKELGWPVYAVAPANDFVYLFSKKSDLMNLLSGTVVKEYQQAANPISTEVWELSDNKQLAFKAFALR
ncbi:hypothetical protein DFR42_1248 [Undibacterium pigrum]|uniref:DUF1444 family protein n=2 Tax=Undibacterium pigrum TaxID=401470 RepID=A0A318J5R3_9BURK|nr:hypothetical protein DFR42_1248 [Undibacterium pigrum]